MAETTIPGCCMRARWIACRLAFASVPALAGPPYQTDDPEPVDYQHYEFYFPSHQTRASSGKSGSLPHFEFNYGALPDLQLHIIAPYAYNGSSSNVTQRGCGDTELGVTYCFMQETDTRPMVGIYPILLRPTGDSNKGLGNGGYNVNEHNQLLFSFDKDIQNVAQTNQLAAYLAYQRTY